MAATVGLARKVEETLPFILGEPSQKLVRNIVRGNFVDMVELLQDNIKVERCKAAGECESSQGHRREVPDILYWPQCFSLYAAVLGDHYPEMC